MKSIVGFLCAVLLVSQLCAGISSEPSSPLRPKWTFQLPAPMGSPKDTLSAVSSDMYFILGANDNLYGINTTTQQLQWARMFELIEFIGVVPSTGFLYVVQFGSMSLINPVTGVVAWQATNLFVDEPFLGKTVAFDHNTILVLASTTFLGTSSLYSLSMATGKILWNDATATSLPAVLGNDIGLDVPPFPFLNPNTSLTAINLKDGSNAWTTLVDVYLAASSSMIVVANMSNPNATGNPLLLILDPSTGAVTKSFTMSSIDFSYVKFGLLQGTNLIFSDDLTFIACLSLTSGTLVWASEMPSLGVLGAKLRGDVLIAQGSDSKVSQLFDLNAFDIKTGSAKFVIKTPPTTANAKVLYVGDYIYIPNLEGFTLFDALTGTLVSRSESGASNFIPNSMQSYGETLYATTESALVEAIGL